MMPVIAQFPDGDKRDIPGCKTATLKAMQESTASGKQAQVVFFRGTGKEGQPVVVKRRLDGTNSSGDPIVLASMFIGS